MTLYQRSVQVLASLAAEAEQSDSSELLGRGTVVASQLDEARAKLLQAKELATVLGVEAPHPDVRGMTKAVAGLEQGLSRWGVKAFQHKSTTTAVEEARNLIRVVDRWGLSAWKLSLNDLGSIVDRALAPDLQGSPGAVVRVQAAAKRLSLALGMNPLTEMERLREQFERDDLAGIIDGIRDRASALEQALDELNAKHEAMPDSVRTALARAHSEEGLPLSVVTPGLLDDLRAAGVIDRLTVRPG